MSDFLSRLADRSVGAAPELRPRVPALYEPIRNQDGVLTSRREPEEGPADARRARAEESARVARATSPPLQRLGPSTDFPKDSPRPTEQTAARGFDNPASVRPPPGPSRLPSSDPPKFDAPAPATDPPRSKAPTPASRVEPVAAALSAQQVFSDSAAPRVSQASPDAEPQSLQAAFRPHSPGAFDAEPQASEDAIRPRSLTTPARVVGEGGSSPEVAPAALPARLPDAQRASQAMGFHVATLESPAPQTSEAASARAISLDAEAAAIAPVQPAPKFERASADESAERRAPPLPAKTFNPTPPSGPTSAAPSVEVTIGRVEVWAVFPAPRAPLAPRSKPTLSLDEYLRRGGGSS